MQKRHTTAQEHIKQQQQQRRFEKAAQEMCGNGVAVVTKQPSLLVRKALREEDMKTAMRLPESIGTATAGSLRYFSRSRL